MSNTKNYFAHGGNELVIGGKLTFLPGATVEGGEGLFDLPAGSPVTALPFLPRLPRRSLKPLTLKRLPRELRAVVPDDRHGR